MLEETRDILLAHAAERFGAIPPERIVDHVLAVTDDADFTVRVAALDALTRRMSFAKRDALVVVGRPSGSVFGVYTTARPYVTELGPDLEAGLIDGACDCADFVRGSLGLCKHLLVVLDTLYAEGATFEGAFDARNVTWDPRLPLNGELDRARGLRIGGVAFEPRAGLPARVEMLAAIARAKGITVSSAARRVLDEELAVARRRLACRTLTSAAEQELASLGRQLYAYQREGVRRFLEEGRLLLADDMGLGKTTQAIAACHALVHTQRVKRGLVIVPASLKPQWLREWRETTGVPARIVDGDPGARRRIYREHERGFLILGYEQLLRDFEHIRTLAPEMVVLDEAQRIKNHATKSAMCVKALTPEYRLVLTGTPMENRLEELASLLDWIDDVALAPKWRLVPWHTRIDGDGDRGIHGARNLATLRQRISIATLRRVRKDVLSQLPSRTDTRVPVPLTAAQAEAHEARVPAIAEIMQKASRRPLTRPEFLHLMSLLTQQRIISNGLAQHEFDTAWPECSKRLPTPAVLDGLSSPKLGIFRGLLEELLAQQRKVVVFSQWRRMLRLAAWAVHDILAAAEQRAVFFTGAESIALRTKAIAEFHDEPNVTVMFLSDAGGVGLNLQRAANACINLELPWNPAVLEQRIGRIYRLGQNKPIDIYNLVTEVGIEARIASLVGSKQALFSGVFEGTTDEVAFEGRAMSQLITSAT